VAAVLRVLSRTGGSSNKKINEKDAEEKDDGNKDHGDVENEQLEQGSRVAGQLLVSTRVGIHVIVTRLIQKTNKDNPFPKCFQNPNMMIRLLYYIYKCQVCITVIRSQINKIINRI
jgi:hypothetical protein